MKNVNQLIGCCGLDCEKCDARIATLTNDNALREKTAALWTKLNVVTITPEMINCIGCCIEGAKTPFCDKLCPVHNCVREKGLDTCADCGQMDGCPTLGQIAVNSPFVLENLRKLRCEEPFQGTYYVLYYSGCKAVCYTNKTVIRVTREAKNARESITLRSWRLVATDGIPTEKI